MFINKPLFILSKMQDPISILKEEHKTCLEQLQKLENSLKKAQKTKDSNSIKKEFDNFYFFIKTEHLMHIRNEEEALYPAILNNPNFIKNRIKQMIKEHQKELYVMEEITELFLKIKQETEDKTLIISEISHRLNSLIESLRRHIWTEENGIYNQVKEKLTKKELDKIKMLCTK